MHIKKHTADLKQLISYAQRDKTLELEVLIKNNKINSDMFYNTIKRLKGNPNILFKGETEVLDIITDNDFRVSVNGTNNILKYCEMNDISIIKELDIIKKNRIKSHDIVNYQLRFNLKRETEFDIKSPETKDLIRNWKTLNKIFRYKKRLSFVSIDKLFQFDLTILKSSDKKSERTNTSKKKKRDVKDFMKKYVIKPEYEPDFNIWFDSLKPNDEVNLVGKKINIPIKFKNIQKSNVFTNKIDYEIELEYLGNKNNYQGDSLSILKNLMGNTAILLQSIQKSYYIISEFEKNNVINEYKKIKKDNDYRFNGPMNVTLEKKHILEKNYEDYQNMLSIRKGYSVTDKADGERNLLIIIDDGTMYLMNRKNEIKYIGSKCIELANSILDCEYIVKDKHNKNINLLMIFDVYFYKNDDIRDRILFRSREEKEHGSINTSRLEVLDEIMEIMDIKLNLESNNNLEIKKKQFYFGDDDIYNIKTQNEIEGYKTAFVLTEDTDMIQLIKELKQDSQIFTECSKILGKKYIYHIDGLIFTPRGLTVGEEPNITKKNKFNGRWYSSFKWKPPEENSIDFLVEIKKNPDNMDNDLITYLDVDGEIKPHKTLILNIGYDPKRHTKYNSMRILNENLMFNDSYSMVPFSPTEYYQSNIHLVNIPLINDNIYTNETNKNIIENNMIVEFSYNESSENKWLPMRIRDNLTPNDFITATNVWRCIHNPITLDMISTGNIDDKENDFNNYYSSKVKRKDKKCLPMNDLHSYIKKKLIVDNTLNDKNFLDTSVGKGGDLNHWIDAEVNMLVGIDISHNGLIDNNNGACNRILNKSAELDNSHIAENYLMIWGDTSKNILDCGGDELNKYYLDIIYGNIPLASLSNGKLRSFYNLGKDTGFDVVSSQFSIHYYFKNEETINTYLNNVSMSLKVGGRFIGTCLNGSTVFEELGPKDTIINEEAVLCWKITKKYSQTIFPPDTSSLGMEIDVYNESIGSTITEYLVNYDYLVFLCSKYNLKLIETASFEKMYSTITDSKYGKIKDMTEELKKYSFMNNYFIFEKV